MSGKQKPHVLGSAGLPGANFVAGYDYDEWHPKLSSDKEIDVYREMGDMDSSIGVSLLLLELLMLQVSDWRFEPSSEMKGDPEAQRWADIMTGMLRDMESTWPEVLSGAFTMLQYGWSSLYKTYKIRKGPGAIDPRLRSRHNDGLWGIRDLSPRAQNTLYRWEIDEDSGDVLGWYQHAPPKYRIELLDRDRLCHFMVRPRRGSPKGTSILRHVYRDWFFKKRFEEILGIGAERDLCGLPYATVPSRIMGDNASSAEQSTYSAVKEMVERVRMDRMGGVVFPAAEENGDKTGFSFGLLSSGGSRTIDLNTTIQQLRSSIMTGMLTQFLLLGQQSVGSFALSSDQTNMTAMAVGAFMDVVAGTIDRDLVPDIMQKNCVPREYWPVMYHGDIEKRDVLKFLQAYSLAVQSGGLVSTVKDENALRDHLGLEPRSDDDELAPGASMVGDIMAGPEPEPLPMVPPDPEPVVDEVEKNDGDMSLVTVDEAVQSMGGKVPRSSLMRAIRSGKMPGTKIGSTYYVERDDLRDAIRGGYGSIT